MLPKQDGPSYNDNNNNSPEDNPFIAFRRFADSHVSSLFNTAFTIPSKLATFANAHRAREQCLFGPADTQQCEILKMLEDRMIQADAVGCQLYRAGHVKAMISKSEELRKLQKEVDGVRRQIVENARGIDPSELRSATNQRDAVEKAATERVWQCGRSWSWESLNPHEQARQVLLERRHCEDRVAHDDDLCIQSANEPIRPHVWGWSLTWPLSAAPQDSDYPTLRRPFRSILDQPGNTIVDETNGFEDFAHAVREAPLLSQHQLYHGHNIPYNHWACRFWDSQFPRARQSLGGYTESLPWEGEETSDEPSYEYEHDHEDQHDEPPGPESNLHESEKEFDKTELDAYEQLFGPATVNMSTAPNRPSVLSTLTTTRRFVASDGTIITQLFLRNRFSDGAEETSETVHTLREQGRGTRPHYLPAFVQDTGCPPWSQVDPERNRKSDKSRGWFWSG